MLVGDMISLGECRKLLADAGHDLSDDDLDRLSQQAYDLADIVLSCYLTRRAGPGASGRLSP